MTPELAEYSKRERQCVRMARLAPTKELHDYTAQLYENNKKTHKEQIEAVNRGDLIVIDGRTVREIMEERYRELELPKQDFEAYYQKNVKSAAKDLVGAALASDQRVELFVPDKNGFISAEPTSVSRTGFKPDPVRQPEAFGSVKKFFMKFGFFKEEAAKAKAQQQMLLAKIAKDAKGALGPFAADLKVETPKLDDFIELSEMTTSRGGLLSATEKKVPEAPEKTASAPAMGRR